MGALLSCMQRADDPSLPLTFPSLQPSAETKSKPKNDDHRTLANILLQISVKSNQTEKPKYQKLKDVQLEITNERNQNIQTR